MTQCFFCQKDCDEMGPFKFVGGEPTCSQECADFLRLQLGTASEPQEAKQPKKRHSKVLKYPSPVHIQSNPFSTIYGSGPKGVEDPSKGFIYDKKRDLEKYGK